MKTIGIIFTSIFLGCLVGGLLTAAVVVTVGGPGGSDVPAIVVFPYVSLTGMWQGSLSIPLILGALLQYPFYGLIAGITWQSRARRFVWLLVAGLHLAAALTAGVLGNAGGQFFR